MKARTLYAHELFARGKVRRKRSLHTEAIATGEGDEKRAIEGFLKAARCLAETHSDPEFYELAVKALAA